MLSLEDKVRRYNELCLRAGREKDSEVIELLYNHMYYVINTFTDEEILKINYVLVETENETYLLIEMKE